MAKLETLLYEEIQDEFDDLGKTELGTDLHKTKVEAITKLCDRAIELEKIKVDQEFKREQLDIDTQLKTKQAEDEKKDRTVKNVLTGAGIVLPLAVHIWGALFTTKFEEKGTYTTIFGRETIKKLFSKK